MTRAALRKSAATGPTKRCAVYTRKSTTMGLEQDFNTLDAQREACENYIRSQAHAGWQVIPDRFDDGGFTGSNLDRPAFTRLLADVEAGNIDVVVVYKIDRVSRSLLDFKTVMDRLNRLGVGFVSITQNFCTTDAVGRMTLNLLATFAEFEREQISERTRDKMLAARRRGLWTGGPVPLGYVTKDKKLVVEELEAVVVREVFSLYLEQRSAIAVTKLLNERQRSTKRHTAEKSGRTREARAWAKDDVLRTLRNSIYAGYMPCGDEIHEGEHEAIIDRETFEAVRTALASLRPGTGHRRRNPDYILGGILFCGCCESALTAASTRKGNGEWRYYRCVRRDKQGADACPTKNLRAERIENFVIERMREATAGAGLGDELVGAVRERVEERRCDLAIERKRLPVEIAKLAAEGSKLVDKVGKVKGGATTLLDRRLESVGAELSRSERRLADVEREIAALEAVEVEAGWVAKCMADFDTVWDLLTSENRGRLLRAVVERVDYDGRTRDVRVTLADLGVPVLEAISA